MTTIPLPRIAALMLAVSAAGVAAQTKPAGDFGKREFESKGAS